MQYFRCFFNNIRPYLIFRLAYARERFVGPRNIAYYANDNTALGGGSSNLYKYQTKAYLAKSIANIIFAI